MNIAAGGTFPAVHVVAFAAAKGGAGKTTLTALTALAAAAEGLRVLTIDADPQGSLSRWSDDADGLGDTVTTVAMASARLDRELPKLAAGADLVLVDTPPGRGDEAIAQAALRAATLAVVPMAPSLLDLGELRHSIDQANRCGTPAVVVLNKVQAGTKLAREVAAALDQLDDVPVLGVQVPLRQAITGAVGTRRAPDPAPVLWAELRRLLEAVHRGH